MRDFLILPTIAFGALFLALALLLLGYDRQHNMWFRPRNLNHRSIRAALDALDDGILFCRPDGTILLCSETMQTLSALLCGGPMENGIDLWNALGKLEPTDQLHILPWKGGYLLRFPGGNTWLFRKAEQEDLLQIAAQNITALDRLEHQVRAKTAIRDEMTPNYAAVQAMNAAAAEEDAKLFQSLDTMTEVTRKMAALYHFFTEHYALPAEKFDYKKLASLTAALTEDLIFPDERRPESSIAVTVSALQLLGVTVEVKGTLPEHRPTAEVFEKLVREAGINAVLHGNATTVVVTLSEEEEGYRCRVSNNGVPLNDALQPGGGIRGIRKALFPLGGTLEIHRTPIFAITANVPFVPTPRPETE